MRRILVFPLLLFLLPIVSAQQSDNYKISDHTFNAGGHPFAGTVLASTSYRITLDSLGDGVVAPDLSSASYSMDGGFGHCYPPPGEVLGLYFTDAETLAWDAERSVGTYNLYRDLMSDLSALGYGDCEQQAITSNTTTDSDEPEAGDGYFYLVTAKNRLAEEGSKGANSDGLERQGTACP